LALDYSLWGLNPLGFHLTNILLHAANTTLLYLLGRRLQNSACALFAALFFGLHPIQVHAVNVISTRGDLLAAFFTLLSLHAFFSRRTVLFPLALMLAALSKETSMVLPLAVLFAWIIVEKGEQGSRLILAFVVLGLYLGVRYSLGFSFSLPRSIFSYETYLAGRLLLACKVLALYCLALFNLFQLPHPFWTAEIPTSVTDPYVLSGISIFGLVMAAILGNLKRNSILAFGLIWFVVYFLPISNLKELNQHGVPAAATLTTLAAIWLLLLLSFFFPERHFYANLLALSGFTGTTCWISICAAQIAFRHYIARGIHFVAKIMAGCAIIAAADSGNFGFQIQVLPA